MDRLDLKNKKITIMGLGLHGGGVGTAKFLVKKGARVTVTDLKSEGELSPSLKKLKGLPIKFVLGKHRTLDFIKTDLVIQNPGVPSDSPYLKLAQKHKIPVEGDISLFWMLCPSRNIIGITGTKGKSTTTALVYLMLRQENRETKMAGNIRISPFEILNKIRKDTPIVLELSSWQLEGLARHKASPPIACIINIFPDHLNRYKSMAEYSEAKKNIFKFQKKDDYVIMNYDSPILRNPRFCLSLKNIYWFSKREKIKQGSFIHKGIIVFCQRNLEHNIASVRNIGLFGKHNLENVLAAVTVACVYGARRTTIQKVLKNFKGLDSRLELIRTFRGVRYYNDTTSTTPTSTLAALNTFSNPIILIAGGADKNLEYSELAKVIVQKVRALILLSGEATPKLEQEVRKILSKPNFPIETINSMEEAVERARFYALKNDIVLLSPACASFGMFQNEFERGKQFNKMVKKIK